MIIRKGRVPASARIDGGNRLEATPLSEAGGLRQFGAHVHTLQPGMRSSDAHWHENEDEFLYVLAGEATVVENGIEYRLCAGDAATWPAGTAVAHYVANRSEAPCSYLICGTRVTRDIVHYPELGQTLHIDGPLWRIVDDDGNLLKKSHQ